METAVCFIVMLAVSFGLESSRRYVTLEDGYVRLHDFGGESSRCMRARCRGLTGGGEWQLECCRIGEDVVVGVEHKCGVHQHTPSGWLWVVKGDGHVQRYQYGGMYGPIPLRGSEPPPSGFLVHRLRNGIGWFDHEARAFTLLPIDGEVVVVGYDRGRVVSTTGVDVVDVDCSRVCGRLPHGEWNDVYGHQGLFIFGGVGYCLLYDVRQGQRFCGSVIGGGCATTIVGASDDEVMMDMGTDVQTVSLRTGRAIRVDSKPQSGRVYYDRVTRRGFTLRGAAFARRENIITEWIGTNHHPNNVQHTDPSMGA